MSSLLSLLGVTEFTPAGYLLLNADLLGGNIKQFKLLEVPAAPFCLLRWSEAERTRSSLQLRVALASLQRSLMVYGPGRRWSGWLGAWNGPAQTGWDHSWEFLDRPGMEANLECAGENVKPEAGEEPSDATAVHHVSSTCS